MEDLIAAILGPPISREQVNENLMHIEALLEYLDEGRNTFERMAEQVPGTLFYVKSETTGDNCIRISVTPLKPKRNLRRNGQ